MRHDAWVGALLWWSCQSPVAHSCRLLCHLKSFHEGMFKFNTKSDEDSLLYSLSYFECKSHTVHIHTQRHLPPPLTSAMKSSLFTLVHSSPLSLAARLQCRANRSHYINNGWTFRVNLVYGFCLCFFFLYIRKDSLRKNFQKIVNQGQQFYWKYVPSARMWPWTHAPSRISQHVSSTLLHFLVLFCLAFIYVDG